MSSPFGNSHNEEFRYGSAGWASDEDMSRAGLFGHRGLQIGFRNNRAVRIDSDSPLITVGGAGSGKLRDQLSYVVCTTPHLRKLVLDPRGELSAISIHTFAAHNKNAHFFNPTAQHGLPMHKLNPLEILDRNSPTLFADAKFIAEGLIALSGSGGGKYFELRSREWLESLMITIVLRDGKVTFSSLMREINSIEGNPIQWAGTLEFMMACEFESIRRTASEMLTKQQDSEREFGSIMGEIYAYMNVFNDPLLQVALDGSDVSLKDFDNLFLIIPAEYVGIWAPLLRAIFTVAMLFKGRNPYAPRLHLIVDEAGQLGKAEFLMRAFTFGRGAGVRCWAVFQDTGQIIRNFGSESLQGFMGSAQTRILFGIRDLQTAEYASRMLGDETLEYDDEVRQSDAKFQKNQIVQNILEGANPVTTAHQYQHLDMSETSRTKQTRRLMTPSEILAMPEDRAIVFLSGKNLKPLYLEKYPYYEQQSMAGLYLPNPYHPPADKVSLKTFWGNFWHEIITTSVPNRFAHLSQYSNGTWKFVKGYQPK